jgi:transcriptional regulator with XRE-family HTH domain
MKKIEIGQIIKERRKYLNITQKDLSEIVGIGLRSLINIENGIGNPTFDQLQKIAAALGMELKIEVK